MGKKLKCFFNRSDFKPFQIPYVLHVLNTVDPKQAPGPDGLGPYMLKAAALVIVKPITHNCNMPLGLNQVPDV